MILANVISNVWFTHVLDIGRQEGLLMLLEETTARWDYTSPGLSQQFGVEEGKLLSMFHVHHS
jgi:hypothetical protein